MFDTMFSRDVQHTLDHFRRSVDQLFDSFYGPTFRSQSTPDRADQVSSVFSPVIESGWSEHELHLRCILPGVGERDVNVSVTGNQLTIEGERKAPEGWTKGAAPRLSYGRFQASLILPNGLDLNKVSCRMHDGVLDIAIPVAEQMKPRRIEVQSGPRAIEAQQSA